MTKTRLAPARTTRNTDTMMMTTTTMLEASPRVRALIATIEANNKIESIPRPCLHPLAETAEAVAATITIVRTGKTTVSAITVSVGLTEIVIMTIVIDQGTRTVTVTVTATATAILTGIVIVATAPDLIGLAATTNIETAIITTIKSTAATILTENPIANVRGPRHNLPHLSLISTHL